MVGSRVTCEPASAYETCARGIQREVTADQPARQRAPDRSFWAKVFVLSVLLVVPVASVVLMAQTANGINRPSDEELIAVFLSHEADFQKLTQMLEADHRRLPLGGEAVELTDLATAGASVTRIGSYESLLRKIDVKNFRYFPLIGNIILSVSETSDGRPGCSKSYRYLPRDEPQRLVAHRGYGLRGPGLYLLTGDRRIKGQWFVHHDTTLAIGFSPY